ncbi:MAG: hypothetical protein BWY91_03129 [bacterium ADurb.BinA028]|nr:MAG: hypothetical protein BWY91_03129 [bacterium ADurb.BinA028]
MDITHPLVDALLVEVGEDHRHLEALDEQQCQLAGHQARTDDAHLGDRAGERAVGSPGRALCALLHQVEGIEAGAQFVAHEKVGQRLVLGGESLVAGGGARGCDKRHRPIRSR